MSALDFPDNPAVGDLYGSSSTKWRWNGTLWESTSGASGARGRVAYAQVTTVQNGITNTIIDLTGLSVTWTADPTRLYRISGQAEMNSIAGDVVILRVADSAGAQVTRAELNTHGYLETMNCSVVQTGLSGTQTRKLQGYRAVGTGTANMYADPTMPAWIMVEDITYEAGTSGVGIEPTAWTEFTLLNGWARYASVPGGFRKVGDIVYLRGYVSAPTPINALTFATLPVGYRLPSTNGATEYAVSGYHGSRAKPTVSADMNGNISVSDGINAGGAVNLGQVSWSVTP